MMSSGYSYGRMLRQWREAVGSKPELKAGVRRFLAAVDEIEDDTKAVMDVLATAMGASR